MTSKKTGKIRPGDWILDVSRPHIMGILNCTPDSFSDGGTFIDPVKALDRIAAMVQEGATMIDIGGESTRPGSDPVSTTEELRRVLPIIEQAIPAFPDVYFSIDTTKFEVARESLRCGVDFINDVSGLRSEPRFVDLCVEYNAGLIIMHSIGNPKTMQENPIYHDVVVDVLNDLTEKATQCVSAGVRNIIIDPGFGFGKNLEHNLSLLKHLDVISNSGFPVLAGISRKSMLGQILNGRDASGRLIATVCAHFYALQKGALILRVHDVAEAADSIRVFEALNNSI